MTRTSVPSAWDDRSVLGSVLDYSRATVRAKCEGVSEADARATPLVTSPLMSLCGLVSHLRWVEGYWFDHMLLGRPDEGPWTDDDPDGDLRLGFETPMARLLDEYETQCAHSRAVVAALDLDAAAARPLEHMPGTTPTLRWILTEMILETSRHVGHIDLLRELADGVTGM
jgi:Protein of unknown function (DUF664)